MKDVYFLLKAAKSAIINIFRKKSFLFKSFVKKDLSFAFMVDLFTITENCMEM